MTDHRARALFSGDVQGVGFRWRTVEAARGLRVTGFVRNLPDGRVELVAEGERAEVERLVEAVASRMRGHVADVETAWSAATGEFRGFGVAR